MKKPSSRLYLKAAEEVDEVVVEETVSESIVEAITDKAAEEGGEVVVEETVAELIVETLEAGEVDEVVVEEPGVESPVDRRVRAIRDKAAGRVEEPGVELPVDGRVRAIRDKSAGRVEDFPGPVVSRNAAVLEKLEKKRSVCNKSRRSSRN